MYNRTGGQSVIQYCGAIYKPGMPLRQRSPDTGETVSGFAGGRFYNSIKKHPQGSGLCGCMIFTGTPYYYNIILLYYYIIILLRASFIPKAQRKLTFVVLLANYAGEPAPVPALRA